MTKAESLAKAIIETTIRRRVANNYEPAIPLKEPPKSQPKKKA